MQLMSLPSSQQVQGQAMVALGPIQLTCYRSAWMYSEVARVNSLFTERNGVPKLTHKLMAIVVLPGQLTQSSWYS